MAPTGAQEVTLCVCVSIDDYVELFNYSCKLHANIIHSLIHFYVSIRDPHFYILTFQNVILCFGQKNLHEI